MRAMICRRRIGRTGARQQSNRSHNKVGSEAVMEANHRRLRSTPNPITVIPAQAGIQTRLRPPSNPDSPGSAMLCYDSRMTQILKTLLAAAAVLAAPAALAHRDSPEVQLEKLLAGRVPGKPVKCIDLSSATSSQIIDGKAIVYRSGSKLYVNAPRSGASLLDRDDVLVTRTFGSQLCNIDTVHLVDSTSRFPSGFVMLGDFVPYTKPKRAAE
jgi:hypothetical protein